MLQVYKNQNVGQAQMQAPTMRRITTGGVAGLMPTDTIQAGQKMAGAISNAMTEYQRIQDNADLADALSELQVQSMTYQGDYKKTRGGIAARDAGQEWMQNVLSSGQEISKRFDGRADLKAQFGQMVKNLGAQSFQNGTNYSVAQNEVYLDDMRKGAMASFKMTLATGSPQQIEQEKSRLLEKLALTYPAGRDLSAVVVAVEQEQAESLLERSISEGDFAEALALWNDFKPQLGVKAPAWLKQIKEAQKAELHFAITVAEFERKKAERLEKAAGAEAEKRLTDLLSGGGLSVADVQGYRDFLSADDYRAWTERALNGPKPATQDDRAEFIRLTDMQIRGEDVSKAAESAYLDGKITQSTYKDFTSAVISEEDKGLLSYLDNALKPSELNANPAQGVSYANARADAMMYLRKNRSAAFKDKDAYIRGVVGRYSLVDPADSTLALPMPRFFEGARADINQQSLDDALLRATDAFNNGDISQEEYEEESERIQNLLNAWTRRQSRRTQMEE